MVRLLCDRYETNSYVKVGGFRSQVQAPYMFSHTEELGYNETVCLWMTIYISSSSSYRAGSMDIPDPLSPLLPIVHRPR